MTLNTIQEIERAIDGLALQQLAELYARLDSHRLSYAPWLNQNEQVTLAAADYLAAATIKATA